MDSDKMQERLGQQASPTYGIIPLGCDYTPDEVGRMLANRVVQPHYAAWLVRKALECHGARVDELQTECNEQARLNGMGAEREARLIAQVAELQAKHDAMAKNAARYLWLRSGDNDEAVLRTVKRTGEPFMLRVTALDAAIDAAMAEGER